jgi:hypothetical protein
MENKRLTRMGESRANQMLKQYNMEYVSPLDLPVGVAREGFVYCWANKDASHQVESLIRQGWEVVSSDRAPGHAIDPFKKYENMNSYFWYKDAILMEISEVLASRIRNYNQSLADNAMASVQGHVSTDTGAMYGGVMRGIHSF